MVSAKTDEKRIAASSYILSFYKELNNLKHNYLVYSNILLEMKNRFKGMDMDKIPEDAKSTLMQQSMNLRYFILGSYNSFVSIKDVLNKGFKNDEISKIYSKIKDQLVLDEDEVEKYVIEINKFLLNDIIQTLLETSQKIVTDIFYDAEPEQQNGTKTAAE